MKELKASGPALIKEVRFIQNSNDKLSIQKQQLTVKINNLCNVSEEFNEKVKLIESQN